MKQIALMIVATAFLTACGKSAEEIHTVDWFKQPENKQVLTETLTACQNNPGTLGQTPNCVNAEEAERQMLWERADKALHESYKQNGY